MIHSKQRGLSLMEILISLMILSIGLLGVLAAIPFGGFQLARMKDADAGTAVARKAFSTIAANKWYVLNVNYLNNIDISAPCIMYDGNPVLRSGSPAYDNVIPFGNICLDNPILIDPLNWNYPSPPFPTPAILRQPYVVYNLPSSLFPASPLSTMVWPNYYVEKGIPVTANYALSDPGVDYFFRSHDELVYGTSPAEINSDNRPSLTGEGAWNGGSDVNNWETVGSLGLATTLPAPPPIPTFLGEYSWMALLRHQGAIEDSVNPGSGNFIVPADTIKQVDVDVAVFRGRADTTPKFLTMVLPAPGTGYQGGGFDVTASTATVAEIAATVKTTSWILLIGTSDEAFYNNTPYSKFARWYKIANYDKNKLLDDLGNPLNGNFTLIGPDTPKCWQGATNIDAILFPDVIGVYSKTFEIPEDK